MERDGRAPVTPCFSISSTEKHGHIDLGEESPRICNQIVNTEEMPLDIFPWTGKTLTENVHHIHTSRPLPASLSKLMIPLSKKHI